MKIRSQSKMLLQIIVFSVLIFIVGSVISLLNMVISVAFWVGTVYVLMKMIKTYKDSKVDYIEQTKLEKDQLLTSGKCPKVIPAHEYMVKRSQADYDFKKLKPPKSRINIH